MIFIDGVKYACERCIRGHRVTTCQHTDQPLTMIKPKGRPSSQCVHCRERRKSQKLHTKCSCGSASVNKSGKKSPVHSSACPCHFDPELCTCAKKSSSSRRASSNPPATNRIASTTTTSGGGTASAAGSPLDRSPSNASASSSAASTTARQRLQQQHRANKQNQAVNSLSSASTTPEEMPPPTSLLDFDMSSLASHESLQVPQNPLAAHQHSPMHFHSPTTTSATTATTTATTTSNENNMYYSGQMQSVPQYYYDPKHFAQHHHQAPTAEGAPPLLETTNFTNQPPTTNPIFDEIPITLDGYALEQDFVMPSSAPAPMNNIHNNNGQFFEWQN